MALQRLIVLMGAAQWQVLRFSGMRYLEARAFAADAQNQAALLHWLKQFPAATVAFLSDIADEHYHVEVLPHIGRGARRQLLDRRLAAWPFAQELHTVHHLDCVQGLRREDRYLFSAIHSPLLREWIQVLQQQGIRIQGVYTQALCLPCWLPCRLPIEAHCLWVHIDRQQIRIRYLHHANLFFSRLLALPPEASVTTYIVQEVTQTHLYLLNQHWLQESESLHLLWLGEEASTHDLLQQPWPRAIKPVHVSYQVFAQPSNEAVPEPLSVMDWMAVQVTLNTCQLPNLAPAEVLMRNSIARAKRMIQRACMVMTCLFAISAWSSHRQLQHMQAEVQTAQAAVLRRQVTMPVLEVGDTALLQLRTQVLAIQALEASMRLPDRALQALHQAMAEQASWQLQTLAWQYGPVAGQNDRADSRWSERVALTFASQGNTTSVSASQAWQQVLDRLRSHADISELVEANTSSSPGSPVLRGDTHQMLEMGDQQQLEIRLHQHGSAR